MAIEGQLQDVGLADICQLLSMGRKTGCLTVTDRANFGYIYFDEGRVVHSTVLNRPDRLGELLVRNNVITREALSAAMEQQAHHPGKRLGQLLVERGSLTEEQLNRFITIQIEEAVYHLFTWERGSFHFDADQQPEQEGLPLVSINTESLLLEGARRVDEWSQIEKKIPSGDLIFVLERDPAAAAMELTEQHRKVLPLLDGERTVDRVVFESGLVEFEVVKALYELLQAGFLQQVGAGAPEAEEEVNRAGERRNLGDAFYRAGMPEDAEREYRAALEENPGDAHSRVRLALLALKGGRAGEALEQLDALPEGAANRGPILRNRGYALELLERYPEAMAALERAETLEPTNPGPVLERGIIRFKARDPDEAHTLFSRYRELLPEGVTPAPLYYAYAIVAAAAAGAMDEALHLGREGLTHHPDSGPILVNLAVALEREGDGEMAEALYLRAVAGTPAPPQAHKSLGDLAYQRGDQAGARAHYERAIRLDPKLGDDTYLKLGNLAYKEGDRDWALHLWRRALELNPGNEVVRTNLELLSAGPGTRG